jgi:hypothetical protein
MMRGLWRTMCASAALGLSGAACAQELYMMDSDGPTLLLMDGPTGVVIDSMPITGALDIGRGLAMRWDGMLFTTADDRLFRIDPKTGEGKTIGDSLPEYMFAIGADPNTGRLYGVSEQSLYQIDHITGAAMLIGHVEADGGMNPIISMDIGRDGFGYVSTMWSIDLFRVDLATAKAEFQCSFGSQWWYTDLAFDANGWMWAVREYDGALRRHEIDTCGRETLSDGWYVEGMAAALPEQGCYPDCNGDEDLSLFDFLCFVNTFNAGSDDADCDGSGALDLFDFLCFVNEFNEGC